ncbi:HAD family phosphatase [Holdemania sp. 1001302B_160321_E10]|uniref:HAD family hydrolase n=1 Tax=Holdemania sp. 1001302B_160321_E10 TaxID=2787120 RepID=UPI00189BBC51|nr:HAD family phosphatase [Holdemania sp. 1001302B_160321_E10]
MMLKGLIFDCDGVLSDTEPKFTQGMLDHLHTFGINADPADLDEFCGMTLRRSCEEVMARYGIKSVSLDQFIQDELACYEYYFQDEYMQPMPGLMEFLNYLTERKIRLGVATSSSTPYIRRLLQLFDIEDRFYTVIAGDQVENGKPDPEIYLKAVELMALPAEELAVIEDSANGIAAAKKAGLKTIGFKGSRIVQNTSAADLEVKSYLELMKLDLF